MFEHKATSEQLTAAYVMLMRNQLIIMDALVSLLLSTSPTNGKQMADIARRMGETQSTIEYLERHGK